jgi:hypothetical protein
MEAFPTSFITKSIQHNFRLLEGRCVSLSKKLIWHWKEERERLEQQKAKRKASRMKRLQKKKVTAQIGSGCTHILQFYSGGHRRRSA